MPESSGSEISLCNTREKQLFDPSSCRGDVSSSDELKNQKPVCEVRLLLGENKIAVRSISAWSHSLEYKQFRNITHCYYLNKYQSRLSVSRVRISQHSNKFTFLSKLWSRFSVVLLFLTQNVFGQKMGWKVISTCCLCHPTDCRGVSQGTHQRWIQPRGHKLPLKLQDSHTSFTALIIPSAVITPVV